MTLTPEQTAAVERVWAWIDRGNPPGGMNVPDRYTGTPSIRDDLRTLLALTDTQAEVVEPEVVKRARYILAGNPYAKWPKDIIEAYNAGLAATAAPGVEASRERFCSGPCMAQLGSSAWKQCNNACTFDDPNRGYRTPESKA